MCTHYSRVTRRKTNLAELVWLEPFYALSLSNFSENTQSSIRWGGRGLAARRLSGDVEEKTPIPSGKCSQNGLKLGGRFRYYGIYTVQESFEAVYMGNLGAELTDSPTGTNLEFPRQSWYYVRNEA